MSAAAIELKDITMTFDGKVLLSNINIRIAVGEKLVLIGPSGEGKSVLLKIMAGILVPTSGQVLIDGKDLNQVHGEEKTQLIARMGMLFQKNALFDSLTCGDNIAFPLREVERAPEQEIRQKVETYLNAVGIPQAKELFPDEISGGMQKRLGIARALSLDPQIIFYDDPTAGLDPITSRMIVDLILRLQKEQNSTLVAITNDMNRAYQLADRIAMVVDSELLITGNRQQTIDHKDQRVHQFTRGELTGPLTESLA